MPCMILLAQDKGQNDFSFKDAIGTAPVVRRVLHAPTYFYLLEANSRNYVHYKYSSILHT